MSLRVISLTLALIAACAFSPRTATAQTPNPNFDAVVWSPLGCDASPLTAFAPRGELDLVGDASFPAAYVGVDPTYLFFRYRVNGDPTGSRGFAASSAWTMLVQSPDGNGSQYQYQLSLNGEGQGGDTIEIWANTEPEDLTFDPLFTDETETRLFSHVHDLAGIANTTPLARLLPTGDGSNFGGRPDWFIDVAFPIAVLIDHGVVPSAAEVGQLLFFPATATLPNRHNKDNLNCSFLPRTTLAVDAAITPDPLSANATGPIRYTISARNTGGVVAKGVVLTHSPLPSYVSAPTVTVSADDPSVTWTVNTENPLEVRVNSLPPGKTITVRIDATAAPSCSDTAVTTIASASAINAGLATDEAAIHLGEVCDGVDNDCDGDVDEGGNALCADANVCNGAETCAGTAGCQPGTPLSCVDGDACTSDACDPIGGCLHNPIPCGPCESPSQCDDHDPCTVDDCQSNACTFTPIANCEPCSTVAECNDANACTDDACNARGMCEHSDRPGCTPCTIALQCDDGDPCTMDACGADGSCMRTAIPGCQRCSNVSECDDGNACTEDGCLATVCVHQPIPDCTICVPSPEVCGGGADEDCDDLVDCADPDCAGGPSCPQAVPENCTNCIDDDGDGRIDAEDPDCCADPMVLAVDHLMLRPGAAHVRGDRLKLRSQYAPATPALFDPLRQDTELQLSDPLGPLFCTTITGGNWRRTKRLTFRFSDKGRGLASGIDAGEFRINRDGRLMFMARGRGVSLRDLEGGNVRLTVRVGKACSGSSMALRPARKGLVFP